VSEFSIYRFVTINPDPNLRCLRFFIRSSHSGKERFVFRLASKGSVNTFCKRRCDSVLEECYPLSVGHPLSLAALDPLLRALPQVSSARYNEPATGDLQ
jgi:hypothetical protein